MQVNNVLLVVKAMTEAKKWTSPDEVHRYLNIAGINKAPLNSDEDIFMAYAQHTLDAIESLKQEGLLRTVMLRQYGNDWEHLRVTTRGKLAIDGLKPPYEVARALAPLDNKLK